MSPSPAPSSSNRDRLWVVVAGVACTLVASACSSTTTGSGGVNTTATSNPSWSKSLGAAVTVTRPVSEAAGTSSPGGVAMTYVATINAGKLSALCPLVDPAAQQACQKGVAGASSNGNKFTNAALGYVAIDGDEALVGLTGTYCDPGATPTCTTNKDPSALLSSGASFASLFTQAIAAQSPSNSSNSYSLFPCIRVDSAWYFDVPASDM
jgi:hypothetical protein